MAILSLVPALLAGTACTSDLAESLPEVSNTGLAIGFDTGKGGFTTRAEVADVSSLREDHVDHVDVFIFDGVTGDIVPNGTGTCYWRVTASEMEENQTQTQTLLDGDWKTSPLDGTDYDVYVVANLHGNGNLSDVMSVADLQAKVEEDTNVYQAQGGTYGGNTPVQDKLFTMTGKVENFNPQVITEDEYVLPVTLTRVAAKILIEVKLSEDFLQNDFTPQSFTQQLKNYAPTAYLLEGRDVDHTYEPTSSTGYTPALVSQVQAGTATFVLYTYPTEWTADVLRETYVIVNIPGTKKHPAEGEQAYQGSNYYKIPLRAVADAKLLERNHIYRVNATVDMMGTYTPDEPLPLETVKYEVAEWVEENVEITGENPRYLVLSEDTIIMKNVDTNSEQKFTSSSFLSPYEGVSEYSVELLKDTKYTFTYNKYGQRVSLGTNLLNQIQRDIDFTENNLQGTITINASVPTNNGVRYMTFRVTNAQGSEAYFLVKQYPLEYITSTEGVRGYRQDASYQSDIYTALKASEQHENGTYTIRYTNHYGSSNDQVINSLNNARMYHIMITSTGGVLDEEDGTIYTLANPLVDETGYTIATEENTNLVAPSFMIASQLGATQTMSFENARRHCNQYREVTKVKQPDGSFKEVTYSGWRMPTLAELKIIKKFQGEDNSAMDVVLSGHQYWYAYEEKTTTGGWWPQEVTYHYTYDPDPSSFDSETERNTSGNIRCVRTASELMAD